MAGWRDLVAQNVQDIRQTKNVNPGLAAFKEIVDKGINLGMTKKAEARQEASASRTVARQAVYNRYPGMAAKEAGVELPQGAAGATGEVPEGYEPYEYTVDKAGETTQKYRAPDVVDAPALLKFYNDYISDVQAANAQVSSALGQERIPVPNFKQWVNTNFPEYNKLIQGDAANTLDTSDILSMRPDDIPIEIWEGTTDAKRRQALKERDLLDE